MIIKKLFRTSLCILFGTVCDAERFKAPKHPDSDLPIAWCHVKSKYCGQEAANDFCRLMGYREASTDFDIAFQTRPPTHYLGSNELCKEDCSTFKFIVCEDKMEKKFRYPNYHQVPLAYCLYKSEYCGGAEAADSFCRYKGYIRNFSFKMRKVPVSKSKYIGNGETCDGPASCRTFNFITCTKIKSY